MRYDDYDHFGRTIDTEKGIKARSKRGDFVENWWAERWIAALERITDAGRLRRGRTYARRGQVLSIEEKKGVIHARVQGSRATPYRVSIHVAALTERQWQNVYSALAERAVFTADLLSGVMPQQIEEAFQAANVSLFPDTGADLDTECSCPDWASPCKHVAATYYILGEQFDEDPFLLFRLRGRDQEQILAALRDQRRTGEVIAETPELYHVEAEAAPPLEAMLDNFWQMVQPLDHFSTSIEAPATPLPILRRLGPAPFVEGDLEKQLGPVYAAMSEHALAAAYDAPEDAGEGANDVHDIGDVGTVDGER